MHASRVTPPSPPWRWVPAPCHHISYAADARGSLHHQSDPVTCRQPARAAASSRVRCPPPQEGLPSCETQYHDKERERDLAIRTLETERAETRKVSWEGSRGAGQSAWEADTLPTELLPLGAIAFQRTSECSPIGRKIRAGDAVCRRTRIWGAGSLASSPCTAAQLIADLKRVLIRPVLPLMRLRA